MLDEGVTEAKGAILISRWGDSSYGLQENPPGRAITPRKVGSLIHFLWGFEKEIGGLTSEGLDLYEENRGRQTVNQQGRFHVGQWTLSDESTVANEISISTNDFRQLKFAWILDLILRPQIWLPFPKPHKSEWRQVLLLSRRWILTESQRPKAENYCTCGETQTQTPNIVSQDKDNSACGFAFLVICILVQAQPLSKGPP